MLDIARRPRSPGRARSGILLAGLIALLATTLIASSASATVMKYAGLDRLVEISDIIVHGTVAEQETYFDEEQGRVVTDTTIEVEKSLYGTSDETVTFQQWGGEHNGQIHAVPGDASFEEDEEVLVFLHRGDDVLALSALGQSKFSITKTDDGKLASRDFRDITVLIQGDDGRDKMAHLSTETRSLESLIAELEALVAGIKHIEPQIPSGGNDTHE